MKPAKLLPLFFACFFAVDSFAAERRFSLDVARSSGKTPVVIYIGNDELAPTGTQTLSRNYKHLTAGIAGKQDHDRPFTEAELAAFQALSPEDQATLKKIAEALPAPTSDSKVAWDTHVLARGMCHPNPKYEGALVILRNFMQRGTAGSFDNNFRWAYCGPNPVSTGQVIQETDLSAHIDEIAVYPHADQPLTHVKTIELLLNDVAALFPPESHTYLVVVHSIGQGGRLISPLFTKDFAETPIGDIRQALLENQSELIGADGSPVAERAFISRFNRIIEALNPGEDPAFGIDGAELFSVLESIPGVTYPLVALDVNDQKLANGPVDFSSIGTVAISSDLDLPLNFLDLEPWFFYVGVTETSLEARMRTIVRPLLNR